MAVQELCHDDHDHANNEGDCDNDDGDIVDDGNCDDNGDDDDDDGGLAIVSDIDKQQ